MLIHLYAFPISGWVFANAKCCSPSLILITYKYFREILSLFLLQAADWDLFSNLWPLSRGLPEIFLWSSLFPCYTTIISSFIIDWTSRAIFVPLCSEKLSVNSLEPWILHQALMTLENVMTENPIFLSFIIFRNPSRSISKHFFLTNIHNHLIFWTTKKGKI